MGWTTSTDYIVGFLNHQQYGLRRAQKISWANLWRISLIQCWNMGTHFTTYYISWPSFNTKNKGSQTTKKVLLKQFGYIEWNNNDYIHVYTYSLYTHIIGHVHINLISHIHIHFLKFHRKIGLLDLCKVTLLVHGDGHPVTNITAHKNCPPKPGAVDGSEIRRSPVEEKVVYPIIYEVFCTIPGGCFGFLPSKVVFQGKVNKSPMQKNTSVLVNTIKMLWFSMAKFR